MKTNAASDEATFGLVRAIFYCVLPTVSGCGTALSREAILRERLQFHFQPAWLSLVECLVGFYHGGYEGPYRKWHSP